jgi:hypothetical protein
MTKRIVPFPSGFWQDADARLAAAGEHYHEHRRGLMRQRWLGLTNIYNLFHARDLSPALVAKVSKKDATEAEAGYSRAARTAPAARGTGVRREPWVVYRHPRRP